jgi:hypothetical protein
MAYQLFPESSAAQGAVPSDDERPSNPLAPWFGRAFPGVHW